MSGKKYPHHKTDTGKWTFPDASATTGTLPDYLLPKVPAKQPPTADNVIGGLQTVKPGGINIESILSIHQHPDGRTPDGYVGFTRKADPPRMYRGKLLTMESVCAIRISELRQWLPPIAEAFLLNDSYFTINTYRRSAPYTLKKFGGLPGVWRKEFNLLYLPACYLDIDVGRDLATADCIEQTLTWRDAVNVIGNLMDKGMLPQASIFARSGRGAYGLYLLRDDKDPASLPRAYPDTLQFYKRINAALQDQFRNLSKDAVRALLPKARAGLYVDNIHDGARVLRVPGSQNTKAPPEDRQVAYLFQADRQGMGYRYTLNQLAEIVGLDTVCVSLPDRIRDTTALRRYPALREVKMPGSAPKRINGFTARSAYRAQDLATIEAAMGGFKQGKRRKSLSFYAMFLRDAGLGKGAVTDAVKKMARNCTPPYPTPADLKKGWDVSIEAIVEDLPPRRIGNKRLCEFFGVTPEIARECDLKSILPPEIVKGKNVAQREIERRERHAIIQELIQANGGQPPAEGYRELAAIIQSIAKEKGVELEVTHVTVRNDFKALGIALVRKAGRPKFDSRDFIQDNQLILKP